MDVSIAKIKAQPGAACDFELEQAVDAAACGYSDFSLDAELKVKGRLCNRGAGRFAAQVTWQTRVRRLCSRCGAAFVRPAQGQLELHFSQLLSSDADGEEDIWPIEQDQVELLPPLLNEIWFQAPMQPLCRPDCRGLCPVCGVDLNQQSCSCAENKIDPRWNVLKNLSQNIEREEN